MAFVSLQYEQFYWHVQISQVHVPVCTLITILGLWNQIKVDALRKKKVIN